jgi:ADP-ribosylglycohydrolase
MNYDVYLFRLAERIAALLPPRTTPPGAEYVLTDVQTTYGGPPHGKASTRNQEVRRTRSHFRGCLLGGAVGDALGAPVEFRSLDEIRRRYGPEGIRDFDEAYGRVGAITDDTQMTLFTAEGLLRAEVRMRHKGICHMPAVVHHAYIRWLHTQGEAADHPWSREELDGWLYQLPDLHDRRAPGNTCLGALRSGRMGTTDEPINRSKGCGTVMRMAPVGLVPETNAFGWGCELAAITHGHPTGILAAGCFAQIIYQIVQGDSLETAVGRAMLLLREQPNHEECAHVLTRALDAVHVGKPSSEVVESLGAGWVAEEALAIAVYCALAYPDDLRAAVTLAVNHSGDSDSTGAITGNIMGVLLGDDAIPQEWLSNLELRREIETVAADMLRWFSGEDEWWERYPGW